MENKDLPTGQTGQPASKQGTTDSLVHNFSETAVMKGSSKSSLIIFVVLLLFGVGTGYLFAGMKNSSLGVGPSSSKEAATSRDEVKVGSIVGSPDEKTFKDNAEGVLKPGGIEGEGAFHLERPGGESQNVYLTSSVIDLSLYVDHKVKVWGQTNSAQAAGWLMDVGRLQVLE